MRFNNGRKGKTDRNPKNLDKTQNGLTEGAVKITLDISLGVH